jgi:hypothetical protein
MNKPYPFSDSSIAAEDQDLYEDELKEHGSIYPVS